jgi:hypothetical protein
LRIHPHFQVAKLSEAAIAEQSFAATSQPYRALRMVRCAGTNKRAGRSDIGNKGGHELSIDLENHLGGIPEHVIVIETGREVVNQLGAPSHAGMLQIPVPFGWALLHSVVVMAWISHFRNVNLEMVSRGHPEGVVHALNVGRFAPRLVLDQG